jgi:hypothetical protein
MDFYTKFILTIIAISLLIIATGKFETQTVYAGPFSSGPTIGDLMDLRNIYDQKKLSEARTKIMRNIPLVRVQGGQISADVN